MEGKILPYSLKAEQSVLGSILLDKDAIVLVTDIIEAKDFYKELHQDIYAAMLRLYMKSEPIDLITVTEEMTKKGAEQSPDEVGYLTDLTAVPDFTSHIVNYAKIVKEKSVLRDLIRASQRIMEKGYSAEEEVEAVLGFAEKEVFDISQSQNTRGLIEISDIVMETYDEMERIYRNKGELTGLTSGFIDLDRKTNGFQKTDLILVAARPAMGKTAFALNLVANAALKGEASVAVFTLEMSRQQLLQRMVAAHSQVMLGNIKNGTLEDEEWERVTSSMHILSNQKIYIDDTPGINAIQLRSKCRRLKIEKGLDLVVIDYLQLMEGDGRTENRQQEISKISRSLKILAKELECPVIALSQLSRAPEQRAEHRPMLADLRESGAIEQDADMVMFLYRDEVYDQDTPDKNMAEVIIAKHRSGEIGTVVLTWLGQYQLFANAPGPELRL
ncbi:MAG: replicative DNA helicase [Filifactor alocis]|nr:replicative DNA helicase [Filifactor alocis]